MICLGGCTCAVCFAKLSMISVLALTATLQNKTGQNGVHESV